MRFCRKLNEKLLKFFLMLSCSLLLCACNDNPPAPVVNAWLEPQQRNADYIVHQGDTIYSIAWQFGLDYAVLAEINHLKSPYKIYAGQHLKMTNVAKGTKIPFRESAPAKAEPKTATKAKPKPATDALSTMIWRWPATGKIIQSYSLGWQGNAGINIAGKLGSPVRAALSGDVVYCGNGIHGYGNLIIIKHDSHYLSAYAYSQKLLVTLGQHVHTGEIIATMGRDNANLAMLHFEIRYNGQAVDPLHYLR